MSSAAGFSHESHNALTVEWYTPSSIFKQIGLHFDIDVCAPPGGLPWVPATRSFCKADDGLAQHWIGRVWCNPPYGKETAVWLKRMSEHRHGVSLVFARTDYAWFHDYAVTADAILFLRGRVRFVDGTNVSKGGGAGAGSMLLAWGDDCVAALVAMAARGEGYLASYTIPEVADLI